MASDARGSGVGSHLVQALLEQSRILSLGLMVAYIFDDNLASRHVLEPFAFEYGGCLPAAARDSRRMHDVSYWYLSL
nr:GNAT family N-acetyltransferase [Bifidobacterium aemilianum]